MQNTLLKTQKIMIEIEDLIKELNQAFVEKKWNEVEKLISLRNKAAEKVLTETLPIELHQNAQQLLLQIKQQDKQLISQAKEIQKDSSSTLIEFNNQKKSIKAYLQPTK